MKWYNKSHYTKALTEIGIDVKLHEHVESYVMRYSKLVFKFMRKVNLEEQSIGVLNLQDIMQIAFEGLIQAWNRVDWDKLSKKPNFQKSLVNYLSSEIPNKIKHRIYKEATGVNVPRHAIDKTYKEMVVDKLFGNWLYGFKLDDMVGKPGNMIRYASMIEYDPSISSSEENDYLNDDITFLMFKYLNDKERDIIRWNFGLDADKLTEIEIADRLGMSRSGVQWAKREALKKLNNCESRLTLNDYL